MYKDVAKAKRHCSNCGEFILKGQWCVGETNRSTCGYYTKRYWCQKCLKEVAELPPEGPPGRKKYPSDFKRESESRERREHIAEERSRLAEERSRLARERLANGGGINFNVSSASILDPATWTIMPDRGRIEDDPVSQIIRRMRARPRPAPRTPDPEKVSAVLEEESESIDV